jgi:hypothetical protein
MRRSVFALALAVLLGAPAAHAGVLVQDASSGLRVDVYTWDGRVCTLKPEATRDAGTCADGDRSSVTSMSDGGSGDLITAAVVHYEGWDLRVRGVRLASYPAKDVDSAELVAQALKLVGSVVQPGDRLVSSGIDATTRVDFNNGIPTVRLAPSIESSDRRALATVVYVVFSNGTYALSFASDGDRAKDVARVADNAMTTLVAAPPFARGFNGSAMDMAFFAGARLAFLAFFVAVGAAIVLWLRSRKAKA